MQILKEPTEHGEQAILKLIRIKGPISRKEIAQSLDVSLPTVSNKVGELLSLGIVREIASGGSGKGRKPSLLEYNRDSGYVIGVDIGGEYIRTALSNMVGEIVSKTEVPALTYRGMDSIIDRVAQTIDEVTEQAGVDAARILSMGVGLPGILGDRSEKTFLSPFLDHATASRLVNLLRSRYNVPIRIENDVDMAVIGEKWKGAAKGHRDIVYVNLGLGLACGIIINGELYRGAHGAAGEIGFMVLDKMHVQGTHTTRGALEQRIAGEGVVANLLERLEKKGIDANIIFPGERDAEAVFAKAISGNQEAQAVLEETLTYFAMALANVIAVLNPEIVVIGGGMGIALGDSLDEIKSIAERHIPRMARMVPSALGAMAGVYGALAVALRTGRSSIGYLISS